LACGEIELADRDRNVLFVAEWPEAWKRYYVESGFIHHDPVINAVDLYRRPFTFRDIVHDVRFSNLDQEMLRSAATYGWSQGLVVPVARGGTRFGLVTLIGHEPGAEGADKDRLCLMSACFLAQVRPLIQSGAGAPVSAVLTGRKLEALRLVVLGCSDAEIAERLGISESTAHKHVEAARKRLKAKNRAELAALGVSFALAQATASERQIDAAEMACFDHSQTLIPAPH
jgi:DNA-binding CsgD family transcriptional regulator